MRALTWALDRCEERPEPRNSSRICSFKEDLDLEGIDLSDQQL